MPTFLDKIKYYDEDGNLQNLQKNIPMYVHYIYAKNQTATNAGHICFAWLSSRPQSFETINEIGVEMYSAGVYYSNNKCLPANGTTLVQTADGKVWWVATDVTTDANKNVMAHIYSQNGIGQTSSHTMSNNTYSIVDFVIQIS